MEQSMYANVHFRQRDSSGNAIDEPFTADDFLGRGNRAARQIQTQMGKAQAMLANAQLSLIKPGDEPEDLPEWAKGEYNAG